LRAYAPKPPVLAAATKAPTAKNTGIKDTMVAEIPVKLAAADYKANHIHFVKHLIRKGKCYYYINFNQSLKVSIVGLYSLRAILSDYFCLG